MRMMDLILTKIPGWSWRWSKHTWLPQHIGWIHLCWQTKNQWKLQVLRCISQRKGLSWWSSKCDCGKASRSAWFQREWESSEKFWRPLKGQYTRNCCIRRLLPAWTLRTLHPREVTLEAWPSIDKEQNGDCGYGEDNHQEEITNFSGLFLAQSFFYRF